MFTRLTTALVLTSLLGATTTAQISGQGSSSAGSSLVLPDFNPEKSFKDLEAGLKKLDPVGKALKEANAKIQPLVDAFQAKPTLENQGKLERALASFTADLSKKIRSAVTSREKVTFAFQDLIRGVRGINASIEHFTASLEQKTRREEKTLAEITAQLREAAEAWDSAEDAEKPKLLATFKKLYHDRQRAAYRVRFLGSLVGHYKALSSGVAKLRGTLSKVQGRVDDVFDRVSDAGDMLAFVAGYRRDASHLVERYRTFFGDGKSSIKTILERIGTIQGRLDIFKRTSQVLDNAGALGPMVGELESLTKGLMESGKDIPTAGSSSGKWAEEIRKVLDGQPGNTK